MAFFPPIIDINFTFYGISVHFKCVHKYSHQFFLKKMLRVTDSASGGDFFALLNGEYTLSKIEKFFYFWCEDIKNKQVGHALLQFCFTYNKEIEKLIDFHLLAVKDTPCIMKKQFLLRHQYLSECLTFREQHILPALNMMDENAVIRNCNQALLTIYTLENNRFK